MKQNNFSFLVLTILQVLFWVSPASALLYEDSDFHYSLTIPDDWVKIDQALLNSSSKEKYNAGFRRKISSKFIYPYMLVDQDKVKTTFDKLAESFKNINYEKVKISDPLVKGTDYDVPIIDEENKKIILQAVVNVEQVGNVKSLSLIFLGKTGIVRLYFYSLEDEFEKDVEVFNSIISSFKFQEGYEAHDSFGSIEAHDRQSLFSVITKMTIGALVGLGFYLLIKSFRKKRENIST